MSLKDFKGNNIKQGLIRLRWNLDFDTWKVWPADRAMHSVLSIQNGAQVKFEANPHFFCIPEICILCFKYHLLPLYTLLKGFETEWSSWLLRLQTGKFLLVPRIYLYLLAFVKWKLPYLRLGSLFQSTPSNVLPAITSWRRMTCGCLELPQTQAAPKVSLMAPFDIIVRVGDVSFFLDPQITLFSLPSAPFNDTKKTQSGSNDISRKAVAGTPSSTGCGLLTPFFQNPSVHTYLLMVPGSKIVGLMIPLSSCCVRNISDTHSNSVCRQEWMVISTCDPSHVLSRIALGFQEGEYLQARLQILQCISIYFHQYVSPFLPQFLNCWWQSFWWPQTAL